MNQIRGIHKQLQNRFSLLTLNFFFTWPGLMLTFNASTNLWISFSPSEPSLFLSNFSKASISHVIQCQRQQHTFVMFFDKYHAWPTSLSPNPSLSSLSAPAPLPHFILRSKIPISVEVLSFLHDYESLNFCLALFDSKGRRVVLVIVKH